MNREYVALVIMNSSDDLILLRRYYMCDGELRYSYSRDLESSFYFTVKGDLQENMDQDVYLGGVTITDPDEIKKYMMMEELLR